MTDPIDSISSLSSSILIFFNLPYCLSFFYLSIKLGLLIFNIGIWFLVGKKFSLSILTSIGNGLDYT